MLVEYYKWKITDYQKIIAPAHKFVRKNLDKIESNKIQKNARKIIHFHCPSFNDNIINPKTMASFLSTFSNSAIFDIELLHTIYEHGKEGVLSTVAYAGGQHFDNIKPILTKLGYRQHNIVKLGEKKEKLLQLAKYLKVIEPSYNSDAKRSQNTVDYLLRYIEYQHNEPELAFIIPVVILMGIVAIIGGAVRGVVVATMF